MDDVNGPLSPLVVAADFSFNKAIPDTVVRRARRSMRNLSSSSCSSLSSVSPPLSSVGAHGSDPESEAGPRSHILPSSQGQSDRTLGERRRKRNSEQEGSRLVTRRKRNPGKRAWGKGRSERRQGARREIPCSIQYKMLDISKKMDKRLKVPKHKIKDGAGVFDLETVKSMGVTVVKWDGV